jgi:hypothetical protein
MSTIKQSYENAQLSLDVYEEAESIKIRLLGKSILRDPTVFILPILQQTVEDAKKKNKRTIIDFTDLKYMNSSTLTPIIKILERIRIESGKVTLKYKKSLKWQDVSFSALIIFQTKDRRIEIIGE